MLYIVIIAAFVYCSMLYADEGVLVLQVTDPQKNPISEVVLTIEGSSSTSPPTTRAGKTHLMLPSGIKPDDWVCLLVVKVGKDSPDWALFNPWDGWVRVPSFEPNNFVRIMLVKRRLRNWLEKKLDGVSPDEVDSTLAELVKAYLKLQERLKRISSEDPAVLDLKEEASKALEDGDLKQADSLLSKAEQIDLDAIKSLKNNISKRQLSLADSYAAHGALSKIRLDYGKAADYYHQAAEWVPEGEDAKLAEYKNEWGWALYEAGIFGQAESPLKEAVEIRECLKDRSKLADSLSNLAVVYRAEGKYADAEDLLSKALQIREDVFEQIRKDVSAEDYRIVAETLNRMAVLYYVQDKYAEAECYFRRALEVMKNILNPESADSLKLADIHSDLAVLCYAQDKYKDMETHLTQAWELRQKLLPEKHPSVAETLNNWALLYYAQGKYIDAETRLLRAKEIWESVFGKEHPYVAETLNNLAVLYSTQGRDTEAETYFRRTLDIWENQFGRNHPKVTMLLRNLQQLQQIEAKSQGYQRVRYELSPHVNPTLETPQSAKDTIPPSVITDVKTFPGSSSNERKLTWTAPGDDGNVGTAAKYIIKYAVTPITDNSIFPWDTAKEVEGAPIPQPAGSQESMLVTGIPTLRDGEIYRFVIRAEDDAGNLSPLDTEPPGVPGKPEHIDN